MSKKRTKKKTPKPQRRSTRNRQRSMKGCEHDEYIQNSQSSPNTSTTADEQGIPLVAPSVQVPDTTTLSASITPTVEKDESSASSEEVSTLSNNIAASTSTVERGTHSVDSSVQVTDASPMLNASSDQVSPTNNTTIRASTITSTPTVEKGVPISSSVEVSIPSNIITASASTVEHGTHDIASSENASFEKPIDIQTPQTLSTPFVSQEDTDLTHLRSLRKPLNLQLELELAEFVQELADSVQDKSNLDFPKSVAAVDQQIVKEIHFVKEDPITNDEDLLALCALHDLYYISPYGHDCVEQIFDGVYEHVDILACYNKKDTEQTSKKPEEKCEETQKIDELQKLYLEEKNMTEKLSSEIDLLHKQLFQKCEKLKISENQVKQLQNTDTYRREVQRLESVVEKMEKEKSELVEKLESQSRKIDMFQGNLSDMRTENTVLKNTAKQQKMQNYSNSDTQTDHVLPKSDLGVQTNPVQTTSEYTTGVGVGFGVDFGVDCSTQTMSVQVDDESTFDVGFGVDFGVDSSTQTVELNWNWENWEKSKDDEKVINELVNHLETIEKSIEYTKSYECLQYIDELVERLAGIEKIVRGEQQINVPSSNAVLDTRSLSKTVHPSGRAYIPSVQDTALASVNQFHPLQHVNNSQQMNNFQVSSTQTFQPPKSTLPVVPGPNSYSEVVRGGMKKATIFSDSMTRDVPMRKVNVSYTGKKVHLHRFPGKKAHHFKHYIPVHMAEDKPDVCVVLAGTNDLPGKKPILNIANDIMEAGVTCRELGASTVIVSSVIPRADREDCQRKGQALNKLIKDLCHQHNFIFMENDNISTSHHLSYDGLHLNKAGSDLLGYNFLWYLNAL